MKKTNKSAGFSLLELLTVLIIGITLTVVAIPVTNNVLMNIRLNAAVASVSGAINTTRYQAIMHGYPYELALNSATRTYQVLSQPGGTGAFGNVGNAVPFTATSGLSLSASTTLQFNPNGIVTATVGATTFSMSYSTLTKTFTVSGVGRVLVQ